MLFGFALSALTRSSGGRGIGCHTGVTSECILRPMRVRITNVAVNPACRRRGIGEGLLTEMKKRAADHKIARIVLEVRVSNEGAIRLYEKQGFSSVGIRRGFYEFPREDARIMVCAL